MAAHYEETFRLRADDFNRFDDIKPSAILDLMQDVAGSHAKESGCGYEDLMAQNLIWVVVRNKIKILKTPKMFSHVKVDTWPKPKGKVDFDREYEIYDEEGNILVQAISKWVVVDYVRRMVVPTRKVTNYSDTDTKANFEGPFDKLEDLDTSSWDKKEIETRFSQVDHNGHINNINYASFIMDAINLKEKHLLDEVEIDYIKELHADEKIIVYYKKIDNSYFAFGYKENNELSFKGKITFKQ